MGPKEQCSQSMDVMMSAPRILYDPGALLLCAMDLEYVFAVIRWLAFTGVFDSQFIVFPSWGRR